MNLLLTFRYQVTQDPDLVFQEYITAWSFCEAVDKLNKQYGDANIILVERVE